MADDDAPALAIEPTPVTIDGQATLKLYVDLVNSERQAIWASNAAMLIGNSFIANAIKSDMTGTNAFADLAFCAAGIAICALWVVMTWLGWGYFHRYIEAAGQLPLPPKANPFSRLGSARLKDAIFLCTMGVIAVFVSLYLVSLYHIVRG